MNIRIAIRKWNVDITRKKFIWTKYNSIFLLYIFCNQKIMWIHTFERYTFDRKNELVLDQTVKAIPLYAWLVINHVTLISPSKKQRYPRIVRKIGSLLRNSPRNSTTIFSTKCSADCNALSRHSVCLVLTSRRGFFAYFYPVSCAACVAHGRYQLDVTSWNSHQDPRVSALVDFYFCDQP